MPAYVVVELAPDRRTTRSRGEAAALTGREMKRLLAEHDAKLIAPPTAEGAGGAPTVSATIAVPDMARADKLAAALRGMDGIEAVYSKPGDELP